MSDQEFEIINRETKKQKAFDFVQQFIMERALFMQVMYHVVTV